VRSGLFRSLARQAVDDARVIGRLGAQELNELRPGAALGRDPVSTREFVAARGLVDRELRHLKRHGHATPESIRLGVMLEVPALLFELDELLAEVDFLSVGTNDLFQFMLAADRGNTRLVGRFDALSPAFLRALKSIAEACARAHVPVTVCGDLASRPLDAMALIAVGYEQLSMPPAAIGPVKAMIRELDVSRLRARLLPRLEPGHASDDIRELLGKIAASSDIPV
jgi:phosphotransferase system enzyme I (PtsP)